MSACYCRGLYDCEECGKDTCNCTCETDGAPDTRDGVMA